ncbi:hypothetical protein MPTK1_4g22250 [Marchantia polymorpha subsp. ruderalis]
MHSENGIFRSRGSENGQKIPRDDGDTKYRCVPSRSVPLPSARKAKKFNETTLAQRESSLFRSEAEDNSRSSRSPTSNSSSSERTAPTTPPPPIPPTSRQLRLSTARPCILYGSRTILLYD